jgi:hypothetical protein
VKFAFIKAHLADAFPVDVACAVLGVSRAGYYAWLKRPAGARADRREALGRKVKDAFEANRRVYGSPRIHQVLRAQGEVVCENTVAKLMKQQRIAAKTRKTFVRRGRPTAATAGRSRPTCWTGGSPRTRPTASGRRTSRTCTRARGGCTLRP